jgi:hypothetical protein
MNSYINKHPLDMWRPHVKIVMDWQEKKRTERNGLFDE